MQVSKWGNSLAVRLPAVVVEALDLKEGDEIEISIAGKRDFKAPDHSLPVLDVAMANVPNTTAPLPVTSLFVEVHSPPGSPPDLRLNLRFF